MGWWTTNKEGESFAENDGPEMLWGDSPADVMGDALMDIIAIFQDDLGRKPSMDELLAGVKFSARVALDR